MFARCSGAALLENIDITLSEVKLQHKRGIHNSKITVRGDKSQQVPYLARLPCPQTVHRTVASNVLSLQRHVPCIQQEPETPSALQRDALYHTQWHAHARRSENQPHSSALDNAGGRLDAVTVSDRRALLSSGHGALRPRRLRCQCRSDSGSGGGTSRWQHTLPSEPHGHDT